MLLRMVQWPHESTGSVIPPDRGTLLVARDWDFEPDQYWFFRIIQDGLNGFIWAFGATLVENMGFRNVTVRVAEMVVITVGTDRLPDPYNACQGGMCMRFHVRAPCLGLTNLERVLQFRSLGGLVAATAPGMGHHFPQGRIVSEIRIQPPGWYLAVQVEAVPPFVGAVFKDEMILSLSLESSNGSPASPQL